MKVLPVAAERGIVLDRVSAGYGRRPVLDSVSAVFRPGAVTMLLGPNGSGKSTLLRLLGGALPFSGSVRLDGRPLKELSHRQRGRMIGVVSQSPSLAFPFRVDEVILLGRLPHRKFLCGWTEEDFERAREAAREMELDGLLSRTAPSLSGGERQRLMIAPAIAQDPVIMLLAEPSSALDPRHALRLFRFLRRRADEGATVVAAVHDINLAAEHGDHVCILKGGRVAAAGEAGSLSAQLLSEVYGTRFEPLGESSAGDGGRRRLWRAV